MRFLRLVPLCAALCATAAPPARAADLKFPPGPYPYTVVNQDLRTVLERFGENIGVHVLISDAVKGTVQGTPQNESAREFLDRICRSYGLDWYYDGSLLAVSTLAERETRNMKLHDMTYDVARRKLAADDVLDDRYEFRRGPNSGTVLVTGPPRYVALVEQELGAAPEGGEENKLVVHEGEKTTIYHGPMYLPQ